MVFQSYVSWFRAAGGPIDPGVLLVSLVRGSWLSSSVSRSAWMRMALFIREGINVMMFSLVNRFFLAA
jgi:hypothetical protein